MKYGIFPVATLALSGLAAMGCGGVPDDDAARLLAASPTQTQTSIGVTAPAETLYFGVTNHLHIAGDVLAKVDLNAGAQVELEVATADSSPLVFELYQVHAGTPAWVELLNAFDTDAGFVLTSFYAPSDNTFMLHFPAPALPRDVNLRWTATGRRDDAPRSCSRVRSATKRRRALPASPARRAMERATRSGGEGRASFRVTRPRARVSLRRRFAGATGPRTATSASRVASGSGMKTSGACSATTLPPR